MKKITLLIAGAVSLGMLSGCMTMKPYEQPKDKEPYALVKLKYKYSAVKPGTTLGARMQIRHGAKSDDDKYFSAFNQSYGPVQNKSSAPRIATEAIRVHPGKKTDMQVAVYFYWYTTQTYTTYVNNVPMVQTQQVYNEASCTADLSFKPEAGKVYLVDYTNPNIDRDCRASAYEQRKLNNGKFKLVRVAKSRET